MEPLAGRDARHLFLALQAQVEGAVPEMGVWAHRAFIDQYNALVEASMHLTPITIPRLPSAGATPPRELLAALAFAITVLGGGAVDENAIGNEAITHDEGSVSESPIVMRRSKPRVFIGCSVEGLQYAKLIQLQLQHSAEVWIWSQGVFGLSSGTLETLVARKDDFDFAVMVLTPDDLVHKRREEAHAPRDNVIFEFGLFMGTLGRERVFMVVKDGTDLPSDLAGITPARFSGEGANPVAAIGPVTTLLEIAMGLIN